MSRAVKFGPQFILKSGLGDRNDPRNPAIREFHPGMDFAAPEGTEIQSVSGGRVIYSGYNAGLGNVVIVRNADGTGSLYAHMRDRPSLTFDEQVREGDIVGRVGNTGTASKGVHLHFSLLSNKATDAIEKEQKRTNYAGGTLSILLKESVDGRPTNVLDPAELVTRIPIPQARPDLGDRRNSNQSVASPADSSLNFNDRFSAIYSPAAMPIGDGRGIGGLPDIAATYDGSGRVGNSSPMVARDFVGSDIPFVARPNGSLAAPGGSTLLDPPMDTRPGPFSTGGGLVPPPLSSRPLYPTGELIPSSNRPADRRGSFENLFGNRSFASAEDSSRPLSPVLRELQKYRASAAPDSVASAPSSTASNFGSPRASSGVGAGIGSGIGGVLKWIGNGVIPSAEASPSKLFTQSGRIAPDLPGENEGSISDADGVSPPLAPDNRQYLSRRIASQGSVFETGASAVPFGPPTVSLSPDRPNAFEDRVENWSSAADVMRSSPAQQVSLSLGTLTGRPLSDWLLPPSIFGFPDRSSDGSGDSRASQESQGTGIPMLDEYIRYLNREYPT